MAESIPVYPAERVAVTLPDGASFSGVLLRARADARPFRILRAGAPMFNCEGRAESGAVLVPFDGAAFMVAGTYADEMATPGAIYCGNDARFHLLTYLRGVLVRNAGRLAELWTTREAWGVLSTNEAAELALCEDAERCLRSRIAALEGSSDTEPARLAALAQAPRHAH